MARPTDLRRRDALRGVAGLLGWTALNNAAAGPQPARATPAPALIARGRQPSRHDFLTSDAVRLSYLSCGTPSQRLPMLFVPGWCMPAELFRAHLIHFAPTRSVFALDPRGHGESDTPESGYDADRRARDLFEFIRRFKRPPIVVAWSLSGIEMLHALHRFGPAAMSALALVDSSLGEGPAGSGDGIEAFRTQLRTDREATLAGFARAIFRSEQSDEQIDALVREMAHVPLEPSLSMLDYRLPRESLRNAARGFTFDAEAFHDGETGASFGARQREKAAQFAQASQEQRDAWAEMTAAVAQSSKRSFQNANNVMREKAEARSKALEQLVASTREQIRLGAQQAGAGA